MTMTSRSVRLWTATLTQTAPPPTTSMSGGPRPPRPKGKKRVLFANDVRFQSSKPQRSYKDRGDKIVKVDVKERFENDNRVNELGFSMHTARLKAQMMTDMV